jgi:prephenate dehydrogenase
MKRTITIAGLGTIGGSIAKAIGQDQNNYIVGYDLQIEELEYAKEHGIIHEFYTDFEQAAQLADVIILAAPISANIELMKELNGISFSKNVIVTDTASVKGSILEAAKKFTNDNITFIGGHPMAGTHRKGVQASRERMFENAIYVLTPTVNSNEKQLEFLKDVLKGTNSHFIVLAPDEHDEMTGVTSHFPHLIASTLVHQAKHWSEKHSFLPNLAAGGFRDITRIASSSPEMWQDIFYHNRNQLSHLLDEWIEEMNYLKQLVEKNDKDEMISYLTNAKMYRDGLPDRNKGAIPAFYDIYIDIKDQPGSLAIVVLLLANNGISIKNIEILEIREGISGSLRISFYSKEAQEKSVKILNEHGYHTMIQD